jgi:hypothetical protein
MNLSELRAKVAEEIEQVPDDKLMELYTLIHGFRLNSKASSSTAKTNMQYAGCWSDLPDEMYSEFLEDVAMRRHQAFSERRNRENSLD